MFESNEHSKRSSTRIPLAVKPMALFNIGDEEETVTQQLKDLKITEPEVAYASVGSSKHRSMSRVSFSMNGGKESKKKKLVISGIQPGDRRKFDGVKRWCEVRFFIYLQRSLHMLIDFFQSFGEVSQIVRMPNGDLHVHFQLVEVADTVCRLRAKVYIANVGSVDLSWYTGIRR